MKKRFIITYAIFASIFILFTLSFLGFNLYKEYKQGDSRTRTVFANTVYDLYSDLGEDYKSNGDFYNKIINSSDSIQDFSFYEIQKNGSVIFSYPGNVSKEQASSKLTKSFSTIINVEDIDYLITCNIYLLKPYSIYHYSKIAFYMILGLTLLTFILILISSKKESIKSNGLEKDSFEEDKEKDELIDLDFNNLEEKKSENDLLDENFDDDLEDIDENIIISNNDLDTAELEPIHKSEPEGLFSDLTGFGWESYLLTRLNNEINRAIASEMDISLFIVKLTHLERKNPLTKKVCDYIATQFQFRDLLFEYKNDCLVIIQTGENLEEALTFAEKIQEDITNLLKETDSKCYIGITTRSVRMISGERFLNEAEQALIHAQEDSDNHIVAFKADTEKYRKYLEQQYDN